jgi:hypothetical protein
MVSKLITLLSMWYGRTTWWKLLIKARKIFIICNALIGVYTIMKITGFSSDNLVSGVFLMGYTYYDMFISTLSRLLHWISKFFDYITPDVPKPKPTMQIPWPNTKEFTWATRPMNPDGLGKIMDLAQNQDFYKSVRGSSSSEWNIPSWVWYGAITVITVGALYLGYVLITSPEFIDSIVPKTKITPPTPPTDPTDEILFQTPASDEMSFLAYIRNKINPFKWFNTQDQVNNQFNNFMERQYNVAHADMSLYPFTVNNPYLPWYKKLSFAMFGESQADEIVRINIKINSITINVNICTNVILLM